MNQTSTYESSSRTLVSNAIIMSAALGIFAIILLAIVASMGAFLLGVDFTMWASAAILAGASLSIAGILLRTWENARWVIVETIAADIGKREAEAAKLKAEAERTLAEADAIAGANNVQIQNVNASDNAKVKAQITAPRVRIQGKEVTWNQLNQLNQTAPEPRRLEFPRDDVLWMLEQFANVKHSKRLFVGETLPYSKLNAYPELYNELMRILCAADAIQGRSDRAAGRLVVKDVGALAKLVDAEHPQGVVLELPATASTPLTQSGI